MQIIGKGLVAQAFLAYEELFEDVVIFASGVSNSLTVNPEAYRREQALLTKALQNCAAEDKRIVYFSSGGAIYGPTNELRHEQTPLRPTTVYGQQQQVCEEAIRYSGVRHLIVRLPNLVGENQNSTQLIPALVQQAIAGQAKLFKHATRDIIDVEDFVRLTIALLQHVKGNETIIIASEISSSIADLFTLICNVLNINPEIQFLERGDQQRFSIEKLRRLLDMPVLFDVRYPAKTIRKYTLKLKL